MRKPLPDPLRPGQESVWDYPRPPAIRPDGRLVEVRHARITIASTSAAIRVLETSHPPGYYLPPSDVRTDLLFREPRHSVCEWKGEATYWGLNIDGDRAGSVAWSYPRPAPGFEQIAGYLSFYPGRVDACLVGGERVAPQAGDFYGGWVLGEIVGPFKGDQGTWGW